MIASESAQAHLVHRAVEIVSVELLTQEILRPEQVMVKLNDEVIVKPLDFGSFAFAVRGVNSKVDDKRGVPVQESSFIEGRRELLRCIFYLLMVTGSQFTMRSYYNWFKLALDWCDENQHRYAFDKVSTAIIAYEQYSQMLYERVVNGTLKPLSAKGMQGGFLRLLEIRFPDEAEYLKGKVLKIRASAGGQKPPRSSDVATYFSACLDLARGIHSFLIGENTFPFNVELNEVKITVFPSNQGLLSPWTENRAVRVYNYEERRVVSSKEYVARAKLANSSSYESVAIALKNISAANRDPRHGFRMKLASLAMKSYAAVFLYITGATPTEFCQFDHVESLKLSKSLLKNDLSAIKFRAGGKKTKYAVGRSNGLEVLREYLVFRKWVLNGAEYHALFFSIKKNQLPGSLDKSFTKKLYRSISGRYISPSIPNVTARSNRRNKSSIMHSMGIDQSIVAEVLGHSAKTNLNSYSENGLEAQEKELSLYWRSVRKAAEVVREQRGADVFPIPSGGCKDFESPVRALQSPAIEPSCGTQQGCLYCKNYICHADFEDIHKLLSLKFVANTVRKVSSDVVHAEALYRDLSIRIEEIVCAISERSIGAAGLVAEVRFKVEELGVLTEYWERRMQRLEHLGVYL